MKRWLRVIFRRWQAFQVGEYYEAFNSLLERSPGAVFLDLGCDTGERTIEMANCIEAGQIIGIEINKERSERALEKGITIHNSDLNTEFPLGDASVDVVTANGVIFYLQDTDNFASEIYRVLKPGGYAVVSALNLASLHNIFALALGYQPFTLINLSFKKPVGNPLLEARPLESAGTRPDSRYQVKGFAYQGLLDFFGVYGFRGESLKGCGYPPLPHPIGKILARIDPRHVYYLIIKVRKNA